MNNKQFAARMILQRGGLIPVDYAMSMAAEGVLLEEFEGSIDGFDVEKFIDDYDFYDNV